MSNLWPVEEPILTSHMHTGKEAFAFYLITLLLLQLSYSIEPLAALKHQVCLLG